MKKNGGSDKELQTRGMKRKWIEDKGPPQKKKRSKGKMDSKVVTKLETIRSSSLGYSPLCPRKQETDSPSNESNEQHIERHFVVNIEALSNDDKIGP